MSEELKPVRCGCGGEAKVYHWNHDPDIEDWYGVRCSKCHINISIGKNREPFWTAKDAIEAWNTAMGERTAKVEMLLCGNCHESRIFDVVTRQHYKYCPSCGARLDWSGNE